jgi:hypothetical protein
MKPAELDPPSILSINIVPPIEICFQMLGVLRLLATTRRDAVPNRT